MRAHVDHRRVNVKFSRCLHNELMAGAQTYIWQLTCTFDTHTTQLTAPAATVGYQGLLSD